MIGIRFVQRDYRFLRIRKSVFSILIDAAFPADPMGSIQTFYGSERRMAKTKSPQRKGLSGM